MAIDKLIPQYLNKDEDARLIKGVEMSDALNVRVSQEPDGDRGIIKNVLGNTAIAASGLSEAYPTGTNSVLGSVASEAGKCIYFFLYNSNGNHGIYHYSHATNTYIKIYENSALNFSLSSFIKADVVINQFGEHLLYFTDNRNEPRKINATKALENNYDAAINNAATADNYLTVCKAAPQTPITFEFLSIEGISSNSLKNNCFQFAYQYVYDDGEVSALSQYSELAVSPTNLAHDITAQNFFEDQNNALRLTLTGLQAPIEKIRVFARRNNEGAFFRIDEVSHVVGTQTIDFANDGIYTFLPDQEANKLFDSVPRKAFSQAISNNRLFYGNYLEGFDNIQTRVLIDPLYKISPSLFDLTGGVGQTLQEFVQSNLLLADTRSGFRFLLGQDYPIDLTNSSLGPFVDSDELAMYYDTGTQAPACVEIDLSDIAQFSTIPAGFFSFDIGVTFDELGMGIPDNIPGQDGQNIFSDYFVYKAVFQDDDGNAPDELSETGAEFKILFLIRQNEGAEYGFQSNTPPGTGIHHLVPIAPLQFSGTADILTETTETANASIEENFANKIIPLLNGVTVTQAFVASPPEGQDHNALGISATGFTYGSTINYDEIFSSDTITGLDPEFNLASNIDIGSVIGIKFEGSITFSLQNGSFLVTNSGPKVQFMLQVEEVNLQAKSLDFFASGLNEIYAPFNFISSSIGGSNFISGEQSGITSLPDNPRTIRDSVNEGIVTAYKGFKTAFQSIEMTSFITNTLAPSFKAGANHEFGVVYYDAKNRPSAVQKLGSVSVSHFGLPDRFGNNGPTDMDIKLLHDPPYWATKWAPVYSKNTTYEKILHVSIMEAALGKTDTYVDPLSPTSINRPVESALAGGAGVIYLSMRGLEGKNNSYKDSLGALLSYEYKEGDMVRVLECLNSNGNKIRPLVEFPISFYNFFRDDENNPIKLSTDSTDNEETIYRRTGWFLGIKDEGIENFSAANIAAGTDFFTNDCIVEIYRPKSQVENQIFYEVGKAFDIVEVNGERTHGGDRPNTDITDPFSVTILSSTSIFSLQRLYNGDAVLLNGSNLQTVFIEQVIPQPVGFNYIISSFTLPGSTINLNEIIGTTFPSSTATFMFPGVVTLNFGDVYFRRRTLLTNPVVAGTPSEITPSNQFYKTYFIEDESVSDFFDSKAVAIGRPHIEMPEQAEIQRTSSVTYSDAFALDSSRLNLSSFNPSLFPFKDYNSRDGDICFMLDNSETLMVMQENKVSSTPIGRTLIEDAGGGQLVTSINVMGTETFYGGDYGPGKQPESVVERFGKIYFCDVAKGAVVEISGKGIKVISANNMDSYFGTKFSDINSIVQTAYVPCGLDPDNDEYIVTIQAIDKNAVSVPSVNGGTLSNVSKSSTTTFSDALCDIIFKDGGNSTWEKLSDNFQLEDQEWDNSGNGVIVLDKLADRGSCIIDSALRTSTSSINVKLTTSNSSLGGTATVSLKDSSVDLPSSVTKQSDGSSISLTLTSTSGHVTAETIAYSTTKEFWLTFYSFQPEMYEKLHDRFFSFFGGVMYRHNVNETRNNFYGVQNNSTLTLVSRANPSDVKVYDAMSLEGNSSWSAVVSNTEQTTGTMASTEFEEREGMYYRQIEKDTTANSTNNTSHKVVLGQVNSVSGSTITFTSKISNLPFGIGDTLFKLESSSETSLSVTLSSVSGRKQITASGTVSGLSAGDTVMAVSTASINGDKMRDYHAQVDLTNTATTPVELFAVNMVYKSSPLHNNSSVPSQDKK